jgi:hypothetical protein
MSDDKRLSTEEAGEIISGWITEIYDDLPPHHRVLPRHACMEIVAQALEQRMCQAVERGGRDKIAVITHMAAEDVASHCEDREPKGLYDPKALITLDGNQMVQMQLATRAHLQQWRDYLARNPEAGCNAGNIVYADTRLALWEDEKTLGELETSYSAEGEN